jgi:hypothetical protein
MRDKSDFDRRTGELNGSLSAAARFTLLLTDYRHHHDYGTTIT